MTGFAEKTSAALLGIVHPVIARDETRVNSVMQCHRLLHLLEKRSHLDCHRSEPTVETNHQHGVTARDAPRVSANNFRQIELAQAKRLLTKNVLASGKRCQHLGRMQMMTSGDYDRVDVRVVEDSLLVGCTVAEAKLLCRVTSVRAVGGAHSDQSHAVKLLERRQQRTHREAACTQSSDPQRCLASKGSGSSLPDQLDFTVWFSLLGIRNQHTQEWLAHPSRYQLIGTLRALNRKTVSDERLNIELPVRQELDKSLHISTFGPTHVADRII